MHDEAADGLQSRSGRIKQTKDKDVVVDDDDDDDDDDTTTTMMMMMVMMLLLLLLLHIYSLIFWYQLELLLLL